MNESSQDFFRRDYVNQSDLRETGFGGTEEEWRYCRDIILQAVDHDGSFLDLGCANGRLAADLQKWAKEKAINLDVYGIDFVPELIEKAKARMPDIASHFETGDINQYTPKQDFDYIRTELIHFDPTKVKDNLQRYFSKVLPNGKLIIAAYDDSAEDQFEAFIEYVNKLQLGDIEIIKNDATCLVILSR